MSGSRPVFGKTDRLPVQYGPYEGIDAIIRGDLYPKPYNVQYRPMAPTAYQPATFQKMLDLYQAGDQKETDKFRERNKQRISATDLNDMARDDLLAMRSAVLAEALDNGRGNIMYTGKNWLKSGAREDYPVGAMGAYVPKVDRTWASNAENFEEPWMSTAAHESLHDYFEQQSMDPQSELSAQQAGRVADGDFQHAMINSLNHKLTGKGRDDLYQSGPGYDAFLEMLERQAERRLGKKFSEKNQGRISSR